MPMVPETIAAYLAIVSIGAIALLIGLFFLVHLMVFAGALPAVPQFEPGVRLAGSNLEAAAGLLADAIALLGRDVARDPSSAACV